MKREITNELIDKLAKVVNLKIDPSQYEVIRQRLIKFDKKFELFDVFSTEALEEVSHTIKSCNKLRKDEPEVENSNEVLKNAPVVIDNFVEIK